MKRINAYLLSLSLSFSPLALAGKSIVGIQIVMDDSGVLQNPEDAQHYKMAMFAGIQRLARRRSLAHAHIDLISTSYGRTVWSGTPLELKRYPARAQELLDKSKSDASRCNNLPGAFAELKSNLEDMPGRGKEEVHVLIFSSLIHTPRPCDEMTRIALPQLPPAEGEFNEAFMSSLDLKSVTFYWVSPFQKRPWKEFLKPAQGWSWNPRIKFNLLDENASKNELPGGISALEGR